MLRPAIRTKIVCTMGTAGDRAEAATIARFLEAGMDVARVNMSHSQAYRQQGTYVRGETYEADRWRLGNIREASQQTGIPVAILGDLQGPKVRVGTFRDRSVTLERGQRFTFHRDPEYPGDAHGVALQYFDEVATLAQPLTQVWLADGLVQLTLSQVLPSEGRMVALVETGGTVGSNQGAIFKGLDLPLPQLTDKDRADLAFLCDQAVDFIALSFLKTPEDVGQVRTAMGSCPIPLIAKIETPEAVQHLDALLQVVDGAMVARGDLGVRCPLDQVPLIQKTIIERCNVLGLPVITATQMLDSMETRPIPTRAEVTDIANAILDGTDALMLSGETAKGQYPLEAIRTLVTVARRVEGREGPFGEEMAARRHPSEPPQSDASFRLTYKERLFKLEAATRLLKAAGHYPASEDRAIADAIARAAADIAESLGLDAILCPTASGGTAKLVARFRPSARILGAVEDPAVARRLLLSYGITPLLFEAPAEASAEDLLRAARDAALQAGHLAPDQHFIFTAGYPLREPGSTNLLKVHKVRS
ncbi:MAG TPA: pyruvate kinase [bacterium]|nr:pyruvate kinase [bacterium]